jgi:hypothetical protein
MRGAAWLAQARQALAQGVGVGGGGGGCFFFACATHCNHCNTSRLMHILLVRVAVVGVKGGSTARLEGGGMPDAAWLAQARQALAQGGCMGVGVWGGGSGGDSVRQRVGTLKSQIWKAGFVRRGNIALIRGAQQHA